MAALRARRTRALTLPALQNTLNEKAKLLYVVFDALFVGGNDIRQKPVLQRKEFLKALLPHDPLLRYSEHVAEFGKRGRASLSRGKNHSNQITPVAPRNAHKPGISANIAT